MYKTMLIKFFASPAGFHFCLDAKAKQKDQDCMYFLTTT